MDVWKRVKDDDYETPEEAWTLITQFLKKKDITIWDPFYSEGLAGKILSNQGYTVEHDNKDFFTKKKATCDVIITNPPYSIKKEIFKRIFIFKKPFAMLVPLSTIACQYFTDEIVSRNLSYQVIIPTRRINYLKQGKTIRGAGFDTVWVCVGLDGVLPPQQIIYCDY